MSTKKIAKHGLTTYEIDSIILCIGINAKTCKASNFSTITKSGWYIILDDSDGDGHATACKIKDGKPIIYFDSCGVNDLTEIIEKGGDELITLNYPIQHESTGLCAWFCLACILTDPFDNESFDDFIGGFDHAGLYEDGCAANEEILSIRLTDLGLFSCSFIR